MTGMIIHTAIQSHRYRDMVYGQIKQRFTAEETRNALPLGQMGLWGRVQEAYATLLQRPDVSQRAAEAMVWEQQWTESAKQLQQVIIEL